jgi:hypothetical protein
MFAPKGGVTGVGWREAGVAGRGGEYGLGIVILYLNRGREESKGPICDDTGNAFGWKHEIKFGAGCLQYRQKGETAVTWHPLHTTQEATECEEVTREGCGMENVERDTYLIRWDLKTRQTVTVLGQFKAKLSTRIGICYIVRKLCDQPTVIVNEYVASRTAAGSNGGHQCRAQRHPPARTLYGD